MTQLTSSQKFVTRAVVASVVLFAGLKEAMAMLDELECTSLLG